MAAKNVSETLFGEFGQSPNQSNTGWVVISSATPLAARMRPRTLDEFVGQSHFLGPDKLLTRMLEADRLSSLIFYGPPGVGKTSLATVIANYTKAEFHHLSAPSASVKDIRDVIEHGPKTGFRSRGTRTVLFIDEIHRFNKAQQDVLLDDVETGSFYTDWCYDGKSVLFSQFAFNFPKYGISVRAFEPGRNIKTAANRG